LSDTEIAAVVDELQGLMEKLRANVGALEAILTSNPEVPGDQRANA
jgi:DNA anti-recombination protein RmuC